MAFQVDIKLPNDRGITGGVADRENLTRRYSVPEFWETFRVERFIPHLILSYKRDESFFEWCVGKAYSLDRSCGESNFEESSLDHGGMANASTCGLRNGSSAIVAEAVSRCHHIANVISVSCFLFCLRIGTFEDKDGSVIDKSGLIDHLASLVDDWKWDGEKCMSAFDQWIDYISGVVDSDMLEKALKLLHRRTLPFLSFAFVNVEYVIMRASTAIDEYAEVDRASKWGDELCNFLQEFRNLFCMSVCTEFFYDDMYKFHRLTAELHLTLGRDERARTLLVALKEMLNDVSDKATVADWRHHKDIAYIEPNRNTLLDQKINVLNLLSTHGSDEDKDQDQQELEECKANRNELGHGPKVCNFLDWSVSLYSDQIYRIFSYFGQMRLSEARECFKEYIMMRDNSTNASFLDFRDFLHSIDDIISFIRHSCSTSTTLDWETVRQKQDFLLDVCEALGDRLLTAKYLAYCGFNHLYSYDKFDARDASTAKLRLQKGLNLQFTSLAPECVQDLISSLHDPCESDEHKRENLPDLLKGFRLINCSIKICSDLLHSWTHRTSNEAEWLKLLESQKGVHDMMLEYHLRVMELCTEAIILSSNANQPLENRIERHSLLCKKPLESAVHGGSDLAAHRVLQIAAGICMSSALVWVERGRARTLLKQLGNRDGGYSAFLKGELIEFDNNYQAAESSITSCLSACKGDPVFIQYYCKISKMPFASFQACAFVVHKYATVQESIMRSGQGDEVKALVDRFYKIVPKLRSDTSFIGEVHSILEKLYDMLIEPVLETPGMEHLDPTAMLVIVPDKTLYRVPFSLLRDKKAEKYLFQLRAVAISPSLRVLQHCERRWRDLENFPLKPQGCILAVGNATYNKHKLLPGTGKELDCLEETFPGRVEILQRDEATRAKFLEIVKQGSCSKEQHIFACIHLGVHGCWTQPNSMDIDNNEEQYAAGSLKFAKPPEYHATQLPYPSVSEHGRGNVNEFRASQCYPSVQMEQELVMEAASFEDAERQGSSFGEVGAVTRGAIFQSMATNDMLSSEDIVKGGFQWRTPLAVLSACDSSRGQEYSDGEVNLPRALMIAGVPAAVVSHWKVEDKVSPLLMDAFYKNLKCGQNVARALQSAMMQLSAPESMFADNIFGWGSFLVWGLPTVQLPLKLWTENARKALPAKEKAELLRCKLYSLVYIDAQHIKLRLLQGLLAVDHFLEYYAACNASTLGDEAIKLSAVFGVEELQSILKSDPFAECGILDVVSALTEQFYAVLLPLEEMTAVELELEKRCDESFMFTFWTHMIYTQAMRGKYELALCYCNKVVEISSKHTKPDEKPDLPDKYIIFRLMGNYTEACEGLDRLLEGQ